MSTLLYCHSADKYSLMEALHLLREISKWFLDSAGYGLPKAIQGFDLSSGTLEKGRNEFLFIRFLAGPTSHLIFDKPVSLPVQEILESKILFMLTSRPLTHSNYQLFQFLLLQFLKIEYACPKSFAAPCTAEKSLTDHGITIILDDF